MGSCFGLPCARISMLHRIRHFQSRVHVATRFEPFVGRKPGCLSALILR